MGLPKKHVCPEHENAERYLLTYADMITLLLALFIVLYAMSIQDPIKFQVVASSLQKAFNTAARSNISDTMISIGNVTNAFAGMTSTGETVGEELTSYATQNELGDQISVTASKDAVVITLAGGMVFSSGSSEMRPEGRQTLEFISDRLKGLPDRNTIRIEGHTDDVSPNTDKFPTNWFLSSARAASAANLLATTGIDRSRLQAVGLAETRPIAPNLTPEGRAKNRRVEIWILPPATQGPAAAATPRPAASR
jgi:chemotaxis protein MotB